jgi:hypothetical protein
MILTPWNDPYFWMTLSGNLPVDFSPIQNLKRDSETGILQALDSQQMKDYLLGGEYDQDVEAGLYNDC